MVRLTEVEDEHFQEKPSGKEQEVLLASDDDDDYTDTDSEISSTAGDLFDALPNESILDRLTALRDIVPPTARRRITSTTSGVTSWGLWGGGWSAKLLYALSTSVLLLGIPWALAYTEEQQMIEMEKEQGMMQRGASEMLAAPGAPGTSAPQGGQGGRAAL